MPGPARSEIKVIKLAFEMAPALGLEINRLEYTRNNERPSQTDSNILLLVNMILAMSIAIFLW